MGESGIPLNKDNIYPSKTSPESVHKAYSDQFQKDFTSFLRFRSEELKPGGRMILTLRGNQTKEESSTNYRPIFVEIIGTILHDMVSEVLFFSPSWYENDAKYVPAFMNIDLV